MTFTVTDNKTGEDLNLEAIALTEPWAKGLVYCDMEGFYVGMDGALVLLDECGNFAYCPAGRFTLRFHETGQTVVNTTGGRWATALDGLFSASPVVCVLTVKMLALLHELGCLKRELEDLEIRSAQSGQ